MNIDPNYQPPEFMALPFAESIRCNHMEMVNLLLQNGAKPLLKEMESGGNCLDLAKKLKNKEAVDLLSKFIT